MIEVDQDGAAATRRALDQGGRAVWVGDPADPELNEFRDEIERRWR